MESNYVFYNFASLLTNGIITPFLTLFFWSLMTLTSLDIEKTAHSARIAIDKAETKRLMLELNDIFSYIKDNLDKISTAGVPPLAHPLDTQQPLRQDCVTEHNELDATQKIAPTLINNLYVVPPAIETDD